ncbi:MAG: peptide deformylase [Bdellovibrionales bacterium]|nr:peptide deformylase [Bdellovibrionales bacterium]
MAKLPVRKFPDPVLREKCGPVETFDSELFQLLDDMAETMYAENGIGLAAPQVGVSQQITVIDVGEENPNLLEFINPQIVARDGNTPSEEGCLSIPEYRDTIKRSERVTVRALDRTGSTFEVEADDLFAICLQHEIDHLNGVLFIDHLSPLKRALFKKWLKKRGPYEE